MPKVRVLIIDDEEDFCENNVDHFLKPSDLKYYCGITYGWAPAFGKQSPEILITCLTSRDGDKQPYQKIFIVKYKSYKCLQ